MEGAAQQWAWWLMEKDGVVPFGSWNVLGPAAQGASADAHRMNSALGITLLSVGARAESQRLCALRLARAK